MAIDLENAAKSTAAAKLPAVRAPSFNCEDCGQSFSGPARAHYDSAHAGMPRYRYADRSGSTIECASCGEKKTSPSANHRRLGEFITKGHQHEEATTPDESSEEEE